MFVGANLHYFLKKAYKAFILTKKAVWRFVDGSISANNDFCCAKNESVCTMTESVC